MNFFLTCMAMVSLSRGYLIDDTEFGNNQNTALTPPCNCGWRNDGRIVGGKETRRNEYPWAVFLSRGCGGSIITSFHVLTAAHCTEGLQPDDIEIMAGWYNFENAQETNHQKLNVSRIIQHELYDNKIIINDISILVAESQIRFDKQVGPVCLPDKLFDLVGQEVKAMGWGLTDETGNRNILHEIDVEVISLEKCKSLWTKRHLSKNQICALTDKKDTCNGDSGGGLIYLNPENNRYTQVALVSYGAKHCANSKPSINTNVYAYIDWIKNAISSSKPGEEGCTGT